MKKYIFITILSIISLPIFSQEQEVKPFQHVDVALTAGSTGVGIDLSAPLTPWLSVRAGASYMPRVNVPFKYAFSLGDVTGGNREDFSGNSSRFKKMNELMESLTGMTISSVVHMNRHTMMDNAKLLFDVYPLKNKHWHATAGFYYGSRTFAYGENIIEDATNFIAVSMYNEMYRKAVNNDPITDGTTFPEEIRQKFISYGKAHVYLGKFTHDIQDEQGNVIHKEGAQFYLEPDEDCKVTADARVNKFKPYVGIGYDGRLLKKDDHWHIGFNAGCMFWGGTPSVIVKRKEMVGNTPKYYELDLMEDVTDLPYYAQKEADLVNALPVFPVLELRLAYRLK